MCSYAKAVWHDVHFSCWIFQQLSSFQTHVSRLIGCDDVVVTLGRESGGGTGVFTFGSRILKCKKGTLFINKKIWSYLVNIGFFAFCECYANLLLQYDCHSNYQKYRARQNNGSQVARIFQARPGRSGKQQQEQSSRNLGTVFFAGPCSINITVGNSNRL